MKAIETFLSHSNKDKKIARIFADNLSVYGFKVFVAHDDIQLGEQWEETLKESIKNCELFLVLLSENFHPSRFTDQEIGIAIAFNKQIFPIRIDETKPYGFMSKFQAKKISIKIDHSQIKLLAQRLSSFTNERINVIDRIIDQLCHAESFNSANTISEILFEYTNFTHNQVNKIAQAFVSNSQVRGGWTARPACLDFLARNWDSISPELQYQLRKYFKFDDIFPNTFLKK